MNVHHSNNQNKSIKAEWTSSHSIITKTIFFISCIGNTRRCVANGSIGRAAVRGHHQMSHDAVSLAHHRNVNGRAMVCRHLFLKHRVTMLVVLSTDEQSVQAIHDFRGAASFLWFRHNINEGGKSLSSTSYWSHWAFSFFFVEFSYIIYPTRTH